MGRPGGRQEDLQVFLTPPGLPSAKRLQAEPALLPGQIVKKLRQMQGVTDYEPGVFVIIIPQISAPVVGLSSPCPAAQPNGQKLTQRELGSCCY